MIASTKSKLAAGVLAVSCAVAFAVATPTVAAPTFDGDWSVVIMTQKGDCDRALRYPIRISNGMLVNAGPIPVDISGRVVNNGAVTVRVAFGDKSASGSGRLAGATGSGSWTGGACKGVWTAQRRS
jgi:hypothetical protein